MDSPPSTEALLAELDGLRALARSLCRDEHDADDLVQHGWLQALRRPPDHPGRLRQWLAVVIRNRSRQQHRDAARRRQRERAAARPEAVGGEADAGQRFELLQQVVAAVDGLAEPYRATILLRYFEECSGPEIAARQGVPLATVRTRLRRGLEQLRVRLDAHHDGERQAWMPILVPFAYAGRLGGSAAATTVAAGITWMSLKHVVLLLALALIALGAWWAYPDDVASTDVATAVGGDPSLRAAAGGSQSPAAATGAVGGRADGVARRQSIPAAARQVTGTVVRRRDQRPAAQVAIRAEWTLGVDLYAAATDSRTIRTDDQGRFRLALPALGTTTLLRLVAVDDAYWFRPRALYLRGEPEPLAPLRIEATHLDARVRGRVSSRAGGPVVDATVRIAGTIERSVVTDARGEYELPVVSGRSTVLWVRAAGYGVQGQSLPPLDAGVVVQRDVVLDPGWRITGRVLDREQQPVARARVRAFHSFWVVTYTDADGRFGLDHFPMAQRRQALSVRHPDFLDGSLEVAIDDRDTEQVIELRRGVEVAGRVVGPDGRPLEAVPVSLRADGLVNRRPDAVTDRDGRFRLVGDPDWRKLCAWRAGYATTFVDVDLERQPAAARDLLVRMVPGVRWQGRVVDAEGQPLAGVHVFLTIGKEQEYLPWNELGRVARSDPDGRFAVADLPAGLLTAGFAKDGYVRVQRECRTDQPLAVVMHRRAGLAGTVVDGHSGLPIRSFRVRLFWPAGVERADMPTGWGAAWSAGRTFTGATGAWSTGDEAFAAGKLVGVEILAPGYAPVVERRRTGFDPRAEQHTTRLVAGGSVLGQVVDDASGAPVAAARVTVLSTARPLLPSTTEHDLDYQETVRTDRAGRFELVDVAEGPVSLLVRAEGRAVAIRREVPVRAGRPTEVGTIRLTAGRRLLVQWTDVEGASRAGVKLRLEAVGVPGESGRSWHATTDAAGSAAFAGLNPGQYRLRRLTAGRQFLAAAFSVPVALGAGAEQRVALREQQGTASLTGAVASPADLADEIAVVLRERVDGASDPADGREWRALVRGGSYRFAGLPAGAFEVRVRRLSGLGGPPRPADELAPARTVQVAGATRLDLQLTGR